MLKETFALIGNHHTMKEKQKAKKCNLAEHTYQAKVSFNFSSGGRLSAAETPRIRKIGYSGGHPATRAASWSRLHPTPAARPTPYFAHKYGGCPLKFREKIRRKRAFQ